MQSRGPCGAHFVGLTSLKTILKLPLCFSFKIFLQCSLLILSNRQVKFEHTCSYPYTVTLGILRWKGCGAQQLRWVNVCVSPH